MKNVLVTGGAGFIGSHLNDVLIDRGHKVCIVDNLSTGNIDNINHLMNNKNFYFNEGSVLDKELLESLVKKVDIIYHLAAAVGVEYILKNPLNSLKTNIIGTENVFELAAKYNKKVIFASTSEVYGKSDKVPFREHDDRVLGAAQIMRWSYACGKAVDEFFALAYRDDKKLPVTIMRLFNTVGPRQTGRYGMVVPRFVEQALNNRAITVYGDGSQVRCFVHVLDVVRGLVDISNCPEAEGNIYNIGSDNEISIKDLALRVKELTNSSSEIVYVPYDKAYGRGFEDMSRRVPDISLIRSTISYKVDHSLDDIIRDIATYFKSKPN
ncbi:MAG: GDP-mannose 4,6-dehydratase [archaeon]